MFKYKKTKQNEWVACGPAKALAEVLEGDGLITVYQRDRSKTDGWIPVEEKVERMGRPFERDGEWMAYGYLNKDFRTKRLANTSHPQNAKATGPSHPNTEEQQKIIDMFVAGETFKVQAYAGAGKTSTLKQMALAVMGQGRQGRYLAFNRAIVLEAKGKMPSNVVASTAHALAKAHTPQEFVARFEQPGDPKLIGPGRALEIARRLQVPELTFPLGGDEKMTYRPGKLAGVVMRALTTFCQSGDPEPARHHFEVIDRIEAEGDTQGTNNRMMHEALLPCLMRAWASLCNPKSRLLDYGHAHYLKQFQLAGTVLDDDFILVDEAQDLSKVLLAIIETQINAGIQTVLVGDTFQSIYGFAGAVDAMQLAPVETTLYLTKSFRFGPAIAEKANLVLDYLGATKPLIGNETIQDRVSPGQCRTTLTRSNAAALAHLLDEIKAGRKPLLIGSVKEIEKFVKACAALQLNETTEHVELSWANTWRDVLAHAAEEPDWEWALMIDLIEEFGVSPILDAMRGMPSKANVADSIVSTAHKVKGLEWESVRLDRGLGWCNEKRPLDEDGARLLYVALTRAQKHLDISAVAFFRRMGAA